MPLSIKNTARRVPQHVHEDLDRLRPVRARRPGDRMIEVDEAAAIDLPLCADNASTVMGPGIDQRVELRRITGNTMLAVFVGGCSAEADRRPRRALRSAEGRAG
jgi:hypothetical protein